jgi:hypothetical protein
MFVQNTFANMTVELQGKAKMFMFSAPTKKMPEKGRPSQERASRNIQPRRPPIAPHCAPWPRIE